MIRKLFAVTLIALATASAAAFAGTSSRDVHASASKQCTAVQAKLGALWFGRTFASFASCVSVLTPLARHNANTAEATCRSERADANFAATHGGKTFAQFYGVGPNHKNAFGKCVSTKERTASAADVAAAPACLTKLGAAFVTCVASKAHSSLTPSPAQPSQEPTQQVPKGDTPIAGCDPAGTGGIPHPLNCAVGMSS